MLDTDCTTGLGSQTDVTLGASPSFGLTATELNPLGYSWTFCYRCEIKPTDQPSIYFDDLITVSGDPLDCSSSLVANAGFVPPSPISYDSAGSTVTVSAGYTSIFDHTQQADCPLQTCRLLEQGCGSPLALPDITIDTSAPFAVYASELNPNGYSQNICFECDVLPTGQSAISIQRDSILVTQNALDCSTSLTSTGFSDPATVPYNSAGYEVTVAADYTAVFTHT